ncbi:MAG: hypothetical protein FWF68_03750, partial [Spirochaetes bacterium]|nr:hypothetical protein [Spirochaetota bacterium]
MPAKELESTIFRTWVISSPFLCMNILHTLYKKYPPSLSYGGRGVGSGGVVHNLSVLSSCEAFGQKPYSLFHSPL